MKKSNHLLIFLQIAIILFFLCILLTSKILTNKILIAITLSLYAIITSKLIHGSEKISLYKKEVLKYMIVFAVMYIALYYVLGIYVGYYKATYKFGMKSIVNYIIPLAVIIITSEIIRSNFLSDNTKISKALTLLFTVVVDLVVYVNIYNLTDVDGFLQALGYIFFASIISNILFNYTSENFGMLPNIAYRIITTIYVYIIPITPDVYIYFKSVCRMIYPLLIYVILRSVYEKDKKIVTSNNRLFKTMSTTVVVIIMIIISMLISCKFTYGILVIGSGSMTGTINKGDAIIYKTIKEVKEIKKGDIIVFMDNKKIIVHRVVKIEDINDEIRLYTKGDNNVQQDPNYITEENIRGIVKLKMSAIGQPTIWLNEFFNGIKRGR